MNKTDTTPTPEEMIAFLECYTVHSLKKQRIEDAGYFEAIRSFIASHALANKDAK